MKNIVTFEKVADDRYNVYKDNRKVAVIEKRKGLVFHRIAYIIHDKPFRYLKDAKEYARGCYE